WQRIDPILAAGKNSFRFARIERAQIRQLIVDLLQDRANFLFLVGSQFHVAHPTLRRVRKKPAWIASAPHCIFSRSHYDIGAGDRACDKSCKDEESDLPSL